MALAIALGPIPDQDLRPGGHRSFGPPGSRPSHRRPPWPPCWGVGAAAPRGRTCCGLGPSPCSLADLRNVVGGVAVVPVKSPDSTDSRPRPATGPSAGGIRFRARRLPPPERRHGGGASGGLCDRAPRPPAGAPASCRHAAPCARSAGRSRREPRMEANLGMYSHALPPTRSDSRIEVFDLGVEGVRSRACRSGRMAGHPRPLRGGHGRLRRPTGLWPMPSLGMRATRGLSGRGRLVYVRAR